MLSSDFLGKFKLVTEAIWRDRPIDSRIYGFQFQPGTHWNPGLSNEQIAEYEDILGTKFPDDFRAFLAEMNGTDTPTLNVYGSAGEPCNGIGVYAYPRDLKIVEQLSGEVRRNQRQLIRTMAEQGFILAPAAALIPIYEHRFLVCTGEPDSSVVLSIDGSDDAIVYGRTLEEYLEREFVTPYLSPSGSACDIKMEGWR